MNTRAVIVVFTDTTGDTEAAMMRNGLRMFRGVERVVPVRGVPSDQEARRLLARDDITQRLHEAEARVRELSHRLENVQSAATGPVPVSSTNDDGVIEWRQSS